MRLATCLQLDNWRVALWTLYALRRVRSDLAAHGVNIAALPAAPALPERTRRAVVATLGRLHATCLEAAAVLQAWDAAHGQRRDVVVGVTKPSSGFRAHAWLDGDRPCQEGGFTELLRISPRRRT